MITKNTPPDSRIPVKENTQRISIADNVLPAVNMDDDGVKFINIYDYGVTDLGKMLAPISHKPFIHPIYGNFQNLQGFWEWIKSEERPDALRYISGRGAIATGRELTKKRHLDNFQDIINQAVFCKIDQNESLRKEFLLSSLPFEMYFIRNPETPNALPIRPSNRDIIVEAHRAVRELMWAGEFPKGLEDYIRPLSSR